MDCLDWWALPYSGLYFSLRYSASSAWLPWDIHSWPSYSNLEEHLRVSFKSCTRVSSGFCWNFITAILFLPNLFFCLFFLQILILRVLSKIPWESNLCVIFILRELDLWEISFQRKWDFNLRTKAYVRIYTVSINNSYGWRIEGVCMCAGVEWWWKAWHYGRQSYKAKFYLNHRGSYNRPWELWAP